MPTTETITELQERAARAQPAETVEYADGWWLRYTTTSVWWLGTVVPHADAAGGELARRVENAEEFYAVRGALPAFQITPGVCPAALDMLLAQRRYRLECPVSLQVASSRDVLDRLGAIAAELRLDDRPPPQWFDVWKAAQRADVDVRTERDLLERIDEPSAYAVAVVDGEVVGVGRAVADSGWAGVFSMATVPSRRERGAGRAVVTSTSRLSVTTPQRSVSTRPPASRRSAHTTTAPSDDPSDHRHGSSGRCRSRARRRVAASMLPWAGTRVALGTLLFVASCGGDDGGLVAAETTGSAAVGVRRR